MKQKRPFPAAYKTNGNPLDEFQPLPEAGKKGNGAEGDRTPGLDIANVALSQLSYSPTGLLKSGVKYIR